MKTTTKKKDTTPSLFGGWTGAQHNAKQAATDLAASLPFLLDAIVAIEQSVAAGGKVYVSQDVLDVAFILERSQEVVGKVLKRFDTVAKALRKTPDAFEPPGLYVVHYDVTEKVSPAWKDEAMDACAQLAQAKGQPFVRELYEQQVRAKYPKSESVSVTVKRVEKK